MQIRSEPIPAHLQESIPELLEEIAEYLTLEESDSFNPGDLESPKYYVAGSQSGFLVFQYSSEDGPGLAFVQHELNTEDLSNAAIGNWPRTEGETVEWSLAESLSYNPD